MRFKGKVFLSGGFSSGWQNIVVNRLKDKFIFFNPESHSLSEADKYTAWDIHFVKECDILFAYMENTNPSGYGLAFELGIAYAMGKTIILVDERSLYDETFSRYFKILQTSSNVIFSNLDEGIKYLESFSIAY